MSEEPVYNVAQRAAFLGDTKPVFGKNRESVMQKRRYGYRLTIEYDGSRYAGWQEQRQVRTVAANCAGR